MKFFMIHFSNIHLNLLENIRHFNDNGKARRDLVSTPFFYYVISLQK